MLFVYLAHFANIGFCFVAAGFLLGAKLMPSSVWSGEIGRIFGEACGMRRALGSMFLILGGASLSLLLTHALESPFSVGILLLHMIVYVEMALRLRPTPHVFAVYGLILVVFNIFAVLSLT